MPMLDDAMFDPATFARPGMLEQLFARGGAAPPGWAPGMAPPMDVPPPPMPPPPMSSGDGGAFMPVPRMPQPDPAALPANSTPATDIPRGNVPETSMLGRIGGKIDDFLQNNRSTLMALGAGMAGSQSLGQGLSRGMHLALPAQQADLAQQKQNQTVKWLVEKKGVSPQEAEAIVNNPELLKQILPQLMGAKQLQHVIIKDRLGNETPMAFNPSTGQYVKADVGTGISGAAGDPNLTGEAYLKTLDPLTRNEVKAFAEGRAPVTARNLQSMLPLVTQYDPGFDASQYPVRLATRKSYTSGKDFQESQALNTVSGHLSNLKDSAEKLEPSDSHLINSARNWFTDTFTQSPRLAKFRTDLVTASNELAKAYHGGHVSDASYAAFQKGINDAQSLPEMKAVIGELADLLHSKIEAKESGYRSSMGPTPLPEEYRATNQHAREAFSKIGDWAKSVPAAASTAPATAAPAASQAPQQPQEGATATGPNGVRVILKGNRWVPVQ